MSISDSCELDVIQPLFGTHLFGRILAIATKVNLGRQLDSSIRDVGVHAEPFE